MNMENFITGFAGHEHEHRAALLQVLGPEKYKYFFDKVRRIVSNTPIMLILCLISSSITSSQAPMPDSLLHWD